MTPRSCNVTLRLNNGLFLQPASFYDLRDISVAEAWFFGECDTDSESRIWHHSRIACSRLPAHLVHHVKLAPVRESCKAATKEEIGEFLAETFEKINS